MNIANHVYEDDQRPCLVAVKPCGCVVGACWIDMDRDFESAIEFREDVKSCGAHLEFRPISFVRNGGLEFDCPHKEAA